MSASLSLPDWVPEGPLRDAGPAVLIAAGLLLLLLLLGAPAACQ